MSAGVCVPAEPRSSGATVTQASHTTAGNPPPYERYPGKKVFYYAPWKRVIYFTTPKVDCKAVYVMHPG